MLKLFGAASDKGRVFLAGSFFFLTGFLVLTVVVTQRGFDGADQVVRSLVQSSPALLRSWMEAASFWGGESGQVPLILLGSAIMWRRHRRWSFSLPMVMAGAGIVQLTAKWAIDRPRPNLDPWGFPSAHVLSLVVLLGYIAYVLATSKLPLRWRRIGVAACGATVSTVAFSRMYLDAHWFSDVLGGFIIGVAYLLMVIWFIRPTPAPLEVYQPAS